MCSKFLEEFFFILCHLVHFNFCHIDSSFAPHIVLFFLVFCCCCFCWTWLFFLFLEYKKTQFCIHWFYTKLSIPTGKWYKIFWSSLFRRFKTIWTILYALITLSRFLFIFLLVRPHTRLPIILGLHFLQYKISKNKTKNVLKLIFKYHKRKQIQTVFVRVWKKQKESKNEGSD